MESNQYSNRRVRYLPIVLSLVLFAVIACFTAYILLTRYREVLPATNIQSIPTLPPPLASVDFPSQTIAYPNDWPTDLRYPDQFRLVDAVSGILPDGSSRVCVAKLFYVGVAQDADNSLSSFFTRQGWQITENNKLDDGGFQLILQRSDKQHNGVIVIDPDTKNQKNTRILGTIWLPLFP